MDVEFLKYKFQDGHDGVIVKTKFKFGVRHIQMLYIFLCSVVMGAMRGGVGIELLAITDTSRRNDSYIQIHEWDRKVQATVLSSFFSGHALALLPAEFQLQRLGDKFTITSILLINGALSSAMPTIVNRGGWAAMCNGHFLMGMTQACLSPVNRALLTRWLPPAERTTFACLIDAGIYLGMLLALPVAGMLTESRLGWELIFYTQAMMTLSMAAMWALLTSSSPDQHQAVGDFEKEFIKEASVGYRQKNLRRPWRRVLRTRRLWAAACAHAAANALFTFYLVDVPLYLRSMGFSLKECGQLSAIPFAVLWASYAATAPSLDWISKTGFVAHLFNVTSLRRLLNALGAIAIVIGLTIQPNLPSQWTYLSISVLIGTLGLLGLQYSGFLGNLRDLTEDYAGTLFAISSAFSGAVCAMAPLVNGLILGGGTEDPQRWKIVFCSMGGFYAVCNFAHAALERDDTNHSEPIETNENYAELEDDAAVSIVLTTGHRS